MTGCGSVVQEDPDHLIRGTAAHTPQLLFWQGGSEGVNDQVDKKDPSRYWK